MKSLVSSAKSTTLAATASNNSSISSGSSSSIRRRPRGKDSLVLALQVLCVLAFSSSTATIANAEKVSVINTDIVNSNSDELRTATTSSSNMGLRLAGLVTRKKTVNVKDGNNRQRLTHISGNDLESSATTKSTTTTTTTVVHLNNGPAYYPCDFEQGYCQVLCEEQCPSVFMNADTLELTAMAACNGICQCESDCAIDAADAASWNGNDFLTCYSNSCECQAARELNNFYVAVSTCGGACVEDCQEMMGVNQGDCELLCSSSCLATCQEEHSYNGNDPSKHVECVDDCMFNVWSQECDETKEYCQIYCSQDCPRSLQEFGMTDESTAIQACDDTCNCEATCAAEAMSINGQWNSQVFFACYLPTCVFQAASQAKNIYVALSSTTSQTATSLCESACMDILGSNQVACMELCGSSCIANCFQQDEDDADVLEKRMLLLDPDNIPCLDDCFATYL
mmetsp:Transcript_4068/g.5348  ORF Transcript_4068/g.5348 Transcript_4068/m.5348 type:complete len:454 (-) Transcript_4068:204-1565(-)|eukprot:CAMPEP_0198145110 /NCGR_PEP_ID=MMETSP1443-20131203/21048_1 /TAXON_ID=186043 /ORGANISM="Entomoneis sp., Strain CCMP2396" /LENGTH=453 /DNA_ID=CAMNT_0043808639 /DNA_START=127 /DNA_END=1488 /DNA_ORIENTATION=+